ncbi:MAG: SAM-dependent chlorinase/fluorinase [Flavobacteriaceae bacterium]|jgi:S-adenosyl-L-methionine hydrolase (adenosine-forming)|nr:SAM-dependent chlorinase/fluorinase [Flavobacteriaceae bacterium]
MSIITLTTDFGNKDFFVASVKGAILSGVKNALIIDISHEIQPYNHSEAAYVLKNAYKTFPKGTIHIIGVESELTPENRHIAMVFEGHYFIGSDNGIFSMIKDDLKAEKIVEINIRENESSSFYVLDAFVKVASHLSRMGKLEVIGKTIKTIKQITNINPVVNNKENQILGSVIYIDNYGNVVTNINKKFFNEIGKSRDYKIFARTVKFENIYESYTDAIDFSSPKEKREEDGKKIAIFNSANHLELGIYKSNPKTYGSAASLFGLDYRDPITVKFE